MGKSEKNIKKPNKKNSAPDEIIPHLNDFEKLSKQQINEIIKGLSAKQKLFGQEYIKQKFNGKRAAIAAGYSALTAEVQASRLLRNVKVFAYIQHLQNAIKLKYDLSVDSLINDLMEVKNRCLQNVKPKLDKFGEPLLTEDKDGTSSEAFIFDPYGAVAAIKEIGKLADLYPAEKSRVEVQKVHLFTQQPG